VIESLDAVLRDGSTTMPKLLRHWAHQTPHALAFREKDYGIWNRMNWEHYYQTARRFALGLKALGFQKGDRLAIASEDTPEWMFSDLATQAIGGIVVGIYPTTRGRNCITSCTTPTAASSSVVIRSRWTRCSMRLRSIPPACPNW